MPSPRRQPAAPIKNFADLPITLLIDDVAAIYRISVKTVRRRLYAGTFRPMPFQVPAQISLAAR